MANNDQRVKQMIKPSYFRANQQASNNASAFKINACPNNPAVARQYATPLANMRMSEQTPHMQTNETRRAPGTSQSSL